jgi:hypothetical protein
MEEIAMEQERALKSLEEKGAAGWAFLVWLFGGGLGAAILVFVVLKLIGG